MTPQLPVAFHAGVFQGTQAVEGHHGGALVVRDAPAVGVVVVQHHGEGVGGPALARGDYVQMGHDHRVALALAVLGVGGVVVHVFRGEAVAPGQFHRGIQGLGAGVPKGVGALCGHGHRGDGHQGLQVFQNIVPVLQDLFSKHAGMLPFCRHKCCRDSIHVNHTCF